MKNIVIDTCVFINIVRDNDAGKNCLKAICSSGGYLLTIYRVGYEYL